jgi:UDP-N-acetylmuramoylalanine--D-glutamate ligase
VLLGGNIGRPVIDMIADSRAGQWNVLELSSFQLETIDTFRAHIGICLNVTQNHLDRHHTFENYASAKGNLFRKQHAGDHAILNAEDEVCRSFAALTPATVDWFNGADIETLMPRADVPLPGRHNADNIMAAAAAANLVGINQPTIAAAVKTFKAVEHRLEFVAELNGIRFYNDSKATSVDATIKALDSFEGNLWVILGGKDKDSDYTVLRDLLARKAHAALLIGSSADKIASQLNGATSLVHSVTLDRAVEYAWSKATPGDTVLLAPACSSFDQFQSYEHRGRHFKELVSTLGKTHGANT